MEKTSTTQQQEAPAPTIIHNHEASCMWVAVAIGAVFFAIAAEKAVEAWKEVELERIRIQGSIRVVEEIGEVY